MNDSEKLRKARSRSDVLEVCSFRIGSAIFGILIRHILEILAKVDPQPVPLAPEFVGGLVHYRGDVLTGVSLRRMLDLPEADGSKAVLILEGPEASFGVFVDSVGEVLSLQGADYEPNPPNLSEKKKSLFQGAYKLRNGLLVLLAAEQLDPARLVSGEAA